MGGASAMVARFSGTSTHTSKGNDFIEVPGARIRCYDAHDDGTIFEGFWAQVTLDAPNRNGYRNIVVRCPLKGEGARTVRYYYLPEKRIFIHPG